MKENRNPAVVITTELLKIAKENLILERQTHLDQLADKLKEDRVRRIILPMIQGVEAKYEEDDAEYCIDLGLIKITREGFVIANRIYKEIIPRELTKVSQNNFLSIYKPDWVNPDGRINVQTLLTMLKQFWNENAGIWSKQIPGYLEAAPQLITQAFLQRVANHNGYVSREYGLGRKRTDLMVKWRYEENGQVFYQSIVMELKTIDKKRKYETVITEALAQTAEYAHICGAMEANILIFDRDGSQNWSGDEPNEIQEYNGVKLEIWKLREAAEGV
jgi:hypothetical protein